VTLEYMLIR